MWSQEQRPMLELAPALDIYSDGIGAVDNLGVNFRATYFVFARGEGGQIERVVVCRLIRPKMSLIGLRAQLDQSPTCRPSRRLNG